MDMAADAMAPICCRHVRCAVCNGTLGPGWASRPINVPILGRFACFVDNNKMYPLACDQGDDVTGWVSKVTVGMIGAWTDPERSGELPASIRT